MEFYPKQKQRLCKYLSIRVVCWNATFLELYWWSELQDNPREEYWLGERSAKIGDNYTQSNPITADYMQW